MPWMPRLFQDWEYDTCHGAELVGRPSRLYARREPSEFAKYTVLSERCQPVGPSCGSLKLSPPHTKSKPSTRSPFASKPTMGTPAISHRERASQLVVQDRLNTVSG